MSLRDRKKRRHAEMNDELPQGWASARLEEIVTKKKGKKPAILRDTPAEGFVPYLDIHAIEKNVVREFAEVKSSRIASKDDLFVVWDGARSGWIGGGITGAIGSTIMALTARTVESAYVRYFIAGQFQNLNTNTRGTGIPHVDPEVFWNLQVPLAPLAEQQRIVAKLEKLLGQVDACQQRLEKMPTLLKRFRQSVLAAACSGRLTADWREENPTEDAAKLIEAVRPARPAKFQDATVRSDLELADVPATWTWTNLRFLISPSEAFCYGVVQPGENAADGVFLVRAGDLVAGRVDTSVLRRIPRSIHDDYRRSQLLGGEILVTVVGAGIGETAIAQRECAGFNIARAVAKLPIREFEARYVHLWLSTSCAQNWMKGDSREVARPTLNLEQLQTLPVPIPPLAEQQEIVRRVESLFALADQLKSRLAQAHGQVCKLTPSLLARAFAGKLVPQNPADEPAEKLLERIRNAK